MDIINKIQRMLMGPSSIAILLKNIKKLKMLRTNYIIVMMARIVLFKLKFYKKCLGFRKQRRRKMKEAHCLVSNC